jgi:hypothetical protein
MPFGERATYTQQNVYAMVSRCASYRFLIFVNWLATVNGYAFKSHHCINTDVIDHLEENRRANK